MIDPDNQTEPGPRITRTHVILLVTAVAVTGQAWGAYNWLTHKDAADHLQAAKTHTAQGDHGSSAIPAIHGGVSETKRQPGATGPAQTRGEEGPPFQGGVTHSKAAIIALKNALQLEPADAEARHRLGSLYIGSRDNLAAENELKLARDKGHAAPERVLTLVDQALRHDAKHAEPWILKVDLQRQAKRRAEVQTACRKAPEPEPDNVPATSPWPPLNSCWAEIRYSSRKRTLFDCSVN